MEQKEIRARAWSYFDVLGVPPGVAGICAREVEKIMPKSIRDLHHLCGAMVIRLFV